MEVEQRHLQAIRQLQLQLAEARDGNGVHKEGAKVAHQNSADSSAYAHNKGNHVNAKDAGTSNGNLSFVSNGKLDGHSYSSSSSISSKVV